MTFHKAESLARQVRKSIVESSKTWDSFPRDLASVVSWSFPISGFMVPDLDTQHVQGWLRRYNIGISVQGADRRLRGVLIASGGVAAILIDPSDMTDEQRFTFAHELAHFLLEYHWPRERALERLGEGIRSVLDGKRPPTPQERMHALLKGVTLGVLTHLMDRAPDLHIRSEKVLSAEDAADALAIELLAPHRRVVDEVSRHIGGWRDARAESKAMSVLGLQFGLPLDVATRYGERIVAAQRARTSFREWLGSNSVNR